MRLLTLIVTSLALAGAISAAEPKPAPGDQLLQSLEQWARENLDDRVLAALEQVDQDRALALFTEMQRRLEGSSLYDLGALRQTAKALVPLLDQFEETIPYAVWLRSHFDYLEAAEEMRRLAPAQPPPKRGAPAPVPPPPTLKLQRSVWDRQLAQRPLPPRAQALVPKLRPIFSAEKVPPQLVWVAEVESSFDSRAKSPAGAAGLFQLMKPTAKSLGLSTWFPDERLNPEKSARAAAKYLRHLHGRFGDWRLALAAYNAGEGTVSNLLKRQQAKTFDAIAALLPAETQMFVPKVEATIRKREGVGLADLKVPKG